MKGNTAIFITLSLPAVFLFLATLLNDNFGRKNTYFVSSIISVLGAVISLVKLEYHMIVFGMFLQVLGSH